MASIPDSHKALIGAPNLVALATVQPDGQPQASPVWADVEDGLIRVNTAAGRQKHTNMIERPQVTVLAIDPENGQRYIEVRGTVVRHTEENGDAVIDKFAKDYLNADSYPFRNPAETRVTFYIEPTHVVTT